MTIPTKSAATTKQFLVSIQSEMNDDIWHAPSVVLNNQRECDIVNEVLSSIGVAFTISEAI